MKSRAFHANRTPAGYLCNDGSPRDDIPSLVRFHFKQYLGSFKRDKRHKMNISLSASVTAFNELPDTISYASNVSQPQQKSSRKAFTATRKSLALSATTAHQLTGWSKVNRCNSVRVSSPRPTSFSLLPRLLPCLVAKLDD